MSKTRIRPARPPLSALEQQFRDDATHLLKLQLLTSKVSRKYIVKQLEARGVYITLASFNSTLGRGTFPLTLYMHIREVLGLASLKAESVPAKGRVTSANNA